MKIALLLHLVSTIAMVGIIWFVQLVHYPLFRYIGNDDFPRYLDRSATLSTFVALPVMLIELATAIVLVALQPQLIPANYLYTGLGLLVIIWISTLFIQGPKHAALAGGFDLDTLKDLSVTNWIRTFAWSARGAIAVLMIKSLLK